MVFRSSGVSLPVKTTVALIRYNMKYVYMQLNLGYLATSYPDFYIIYSFIYFHLKCCSKQEQKYMV